MFRTKNPALKNNPFGPAQTWQDLETRGATGLPQEHAEARPGAMTVQGTVIKTAVLFSFCAVTAITAWNVTLENPGLAWKLMLGGIAGHFILSLITVFKPHVATFTAPLVAIAEGILVGGISAVYAQQFAQESGQLNTAMILNAGLITFGVVGGLLTAYGFRIIRPNRTFRNVTVTLTIGLLFYMAIAFVAGMFGSYSLVSVYDPSNGGMISIGFSLFVIALASANLVLDFQVIEEGAINGAPKYMEWYGGFVVLITVVWMYLEILRLLAKLQSRD